MTDQTESAREEAAFIARKAAEFEADGLPFTESIEFALRESFRQRAAEPTEDEAFAQHQIASEARTLRSEMHELAGSARSMADRLDKLVRRIEGRG